MEKHKQYNLNSKNSENDNSSSILNQNKTQYEKDWVSSESILRSDKTLNIKDKFLINESDIIMRLGQTWKRTAVNTLVTGSVYSVTTNDFLIGVTNLSYAPTIGLPQPRLVGEGKAFVIKDEAGGAGTTTITIVSTDGVLLDGATSVTLPNNYSSRTMYTDGANYFTI